MDIRYSYRVLEKYIKKESLEDKIFIDESDISDVSAWINHGIFDFKDKHMTKEDLKITWDGTISDLYEDFSLVLDNSIYIAILYEDKVDPLTNKVIESTELDRVNLNKKLSAQLCDYWFLVDSQGLRQRLSDLSWLSDFRMFKDEDWYNQQLALFNFRYNTDLEDHLVKDVYSALRDFYNKISYYLDDYSIESVMTISMQAENVFEEDYELDVARVMFRLIWPLMSNFYDLDKKAINIKDFRVFYV